MSFVLKGTLLQEVCRSLRFLPVLKKFAGNAQIRLLCERKIGQLDLEAVTVSVVSIIILMLLFSKLSESSVVLKEEVVFTVPA